MSTVQRVSADKSTDDADSGTGKKKRTRLSPEKRRAEILRAASQVILSAGVSELTMEAVAVEAGVSRSLVYFYFPTVEEMMRELVRTEFGAIYEALIPVMEGTGTLEERVEAKVHAYFGAVEERYELFAILNAALDSPQYRQDRRERFKWWESYVGDLVGSEYEIDPRLARTLARLMMAVDGRCINLWKREGYDRAEIESISARFQIAGLREILGPDSSGAD